MLLRSFTCLPRTGASALEASGMRGVNGGPSASRSMLGCARDLLYEADQVSFTVPNRRTDADRRAKIHALPHESHVSDLELSGEFRDVSRLEHKCFIPDWEEVIRRVREERVDAVPTRGLEQLDIYMPAPRTIAASAPTASTRDRLTSSNSSTSSHQAIDFSRSSTARAIPASRTSSRPRILEIMTASLSRV